MADMRPPHALSAGRAARLGATRGFHHGLLGLAAAPGLDFTGADNDWATKCDLVINPNLVEVTSECDAPPAPATWSNAFGGGTGIRAGAAFGYRLGAIRIEGEYFQRVTVFDERSDITITDVVTLGKQDQEIASAVGGLDDLRSHAFFANAYYDFRPAGSSWTPYVGAGVGMERASIYYFTHWTRNDDPSRIATFVDPALRAKLAGTTTIGSDSLTDTMAGYQVLAGVDRRLGASATLGLKFRWAGFGAFASAPREWNQLRSHDSTVGRGEPIRYTVATNGNRFWGLSLSLKYHF